MPSLSEWSQFEREYGDSFNNAREGALLLSISVNDIVYVVQTDAAEFKIVTQSRYESGWRIKHAVDDSCITAVYQHGREV